MGLARDSCCHFEAPRRDRGSTDSANSSEVLSSPRSSENPVQPQLTTRALRCVVLSQSNQSDIAPVRKVVMLGQARTRFGRAR
jgi:hypothetical protein